MFVLQGGEHMNKLLKDLYDCFYTPPELAATKREIEECQGPYFGGHFARQLHLWISAGVAAVRRIESL